MKKRTICLLLVFAFVMTLLPVMAFAADNEEETVPTHLKDLVTTKTLEGSDDEGYSLRLESYATGEIKQQSVQEQVPTDFVLVVDQSGSMKYEDMPSGGFEFYENNVALKDIPATTETENAEDALYVKVRVNDDGTETVVTEAQYQQNPNANYKHYRVYKKRGYMYRYFPGGDSLYSGDMFPEEKAHLFVNEDVTQTGSSAFYIKKNGEYAQLFVNIAAGVLLYNINFYYNDPQTGERTRITRPSEPWYRPWGDIGETIKPGTGTISKLYYGAVNGAVTRLATSGSYTYGEFEIPLLFTTIKAKTGMYIDFDVYQRYIGYNELCYMDGDGVERTLVSSEYCNANADPVTGASSNTDATFNGSLYKSSGTETRLSALNTAAKAFINNVANQVNVDKDGNETPVDHRISIAGFSSDGYSNTELLSGVNIERDDSFGGYSLKPRGYSGYYGFDGVQYSSSQFPGSCRQSLVEASTSAGKQSLMDSVDAITAYGGTKAQDGFAMAKEILASRSVEDRKYTKADGTEGERNTIVIFFTDGRPGMNELSDQIDYANSTIEKAKEVKDLGATVYSVGVFGESDGNALTFPKYRITERNGGATINGVTYQYDSNYADSLEKYSYDSNFDKVVEDTTGLIITNKYADVLYRVWDAYGAGYTDNPTDTISDYMRTVSSEYPKAEEFMDKNWYKSSNPSGSYADMIRNARKTDNHDTSKRYYYMASSADELKSVFEEISSSIEVPTTEVPLNQSSVLRDVISSNMELPAGFNASNVEAYTVPCKSITKDENDKDVIAFYENDKTPIAGVTVNAGTRTVDVSGFDYSADNNIVALDTNDHPKGKKLVVIIKGLSAKEPLRMTEQDTNDVGSGIYADRADEKPAVTWKSPTLPANAFKVIHKDEKGDQIGDPQLVKADGTFDATLLIPTHVNNEGKTVYDKLYGGIFSDEAMTKVAVKTGETGKSFTPDIGQTYYLKEVDPSYLDIRTIYTTYGQDLIGRYDVTFTDNAEYSYVGFDYDDNGFAQSDSFYDKVNVITYKQGQQIPNYYNVADLFNGASGKLGINEQNNKAYGGTIHPYWVTKDGVKVTGPVIRNIQSLKYAKEDRTDTTDNAFIEFSTYDGDLTDGLHSNGIFVADPGAEDDVTPAESKAVIRGYTLSLKGNIAMNFYTELSDDVANDPNAYMQFTLPGGNHTAEKVMVSEARIGEVDGKQCYIFPAGIAAKDMTGDIKAQFIQPGGIQSEQKTTSVKWYCDKIIANKDGKYSEKSVELAKAIENYGGYAQLSFGYKTDDLANAGKDYPLPEIDLESIADPVKSGTCTGAKYLGTTAMLTTTTGLRHYFKLDNDAAEYSFTVNGEELEVGSDSKGAYVLIDDIWAKSLGDPIQLTVTNKEDDTTFTLSYSVYNYVKQALKGKSTRSETKDMVKALYGYGEAAKAYLATED